MKKIISAIILLSLLCTTVYGDYDFTEQRMGDNGYWAFRKISEYVVDVYNYTLGDGHDDPRRVAGKYYDLRYENFEPTTAPRVELTPSPEPEAVFYPIDNSENQIKVIAKSYSIVDKDGNVVVPEGEYDLIAVSDGVLVARKDDRYVIISPDGSVINPLNIKLTNGFKLNEYGVAVASKEIDGEEKYGLINSKFEVLADFEYDCINYIIDASDNHKEYGRFYYGAAAVEKDGKVAVMDYTGKIRTPFRYSRVYVNSRSEISVEYKDGDVEHYGYLKDDFTEYVNIENVSYFLIGKERLVIKDEKGSRLARLDGTAVSFYYKGISYFSDEKFTDRFVHIYNQDGKDGVMDMNGRVIIPPGYEKIYGYVAVKNGTRFKCEKSDGNYVYYDEKGNVIEHPEEDYERITDGYYRKTVNGKTAVFDEEENPVTDYLYDSIYSSQIRKIDGSKVFKAKIKDEVKYLDKNFSEIDVFSADTPCYTDSSVDYRRDDLIVGKIDGKYSLIDAVNQVTVIPYSADLKLGYCGKNISVTDGLKTYIADSDSYEIIAEFPFSGKYSIYMLDDVFYKKWDDSLETIYDFTGKDVFGKTFNDIVKMSDGVYVGTTSDSVWLYKSDVLNLAYNTDVRTYINGMEIPCYKVDGYNYVFAEDLDNYGFDLEWNGESKTLDLTWDGEFLPLEIPEKGENNTEFADIFKNDVTVRINGEEVPSYNTNGKMLVKTKDLEQFGLEVTFENQKTIFDILNEIKVYVNDKKVAFDQPPIIVNDRTLVPLRKIFEALGAVVEWDEETSTVTSVKDDTTITLQIGDNIMYVNDEGIELDVPAQLVNDRTLVPVRAISEAFGCTVDWDGDTNTVTVKN